MEETPNVVSRQGILEGPFRNNPAVRLAIDLWRRGGCTWEEAMMYTVVQLAGRLERLEGQARDKIAKEPPSNWNGIQQLLVGR